jgi:hypothetical protein
MPVKRITIIILIITILGFICAGSCAGQPSAESKGPVLGNWAFDGKDDKGVVWTGTITIKELDTKNFDASEYYAGCVLDAASKDSGKGVDGPCVWNSGTREFSFRAGGSAYSAILSVDCKSMTQGKWTVTEKDFRTRKVTVTNTGDWSAKYTGP